MSIKNSEIIIKPMVDEGFLKGLGVIKRGHFLLTSGLHSDIYFEKFRILENPDVTRQLIEFKIHELSALRPDIVAGPTLGGVLVAYEVARQLSCKAIYIERIEGRRVIKRDFSLKGNERVLLVDDVVTTGSSIIESIELLKNRGLQVVGVFSLIDRSEGVDFGFPFITVFKVKANVYKPDECPLCKRGIPLVKPGGNPIL